MRHKQLHESLCTHTTTALIPSSLLNSHRELYYQEQFVSIHTKPSSLKRSECCLIYGHIYGTETGQPFAYRHGHWPPRVFVATIFSMNSCVHHCLPGAVHHHETRPHHSAWKQNMAVFQVAPSPRICTGFWTNCRNKTISLTGSLMPLQARLLMMVHLLMPEGAGRACHK